MNRREFLTWVGVGGVASFLPVAIAACSPESTDTPTPQNQPVSSPQADGFQSVGTVTTLEQQGQISIPQFAGAPLLVVRDPADQQRLVAVNAACTHKGCPVDWQAEQQKFICACHDSHFGLGGEVLKGPAKQPLKTYAAKIEKDAVLVKAVG
jgi:cytochrome b6-f complex iron-sulfur subunit